LANFKNIIPENKECFIKLIPNTKIPLQKNWLNKGTNTWLNQSKKP